MEPQETTRNFNWDISGADTQTFMLGNIRDITKQSVYDTTYKITGFEPGIPYQLNTTVFNRYTSTSTEYNPESNLEYMWFTSNIDHLEFTNEHTKLWDFVAIQEEEQIRIQVNHSLSDTSMQILEDFSVKFDFYAESPLSTTSICLHTYEMTINDNEEEFILHDVNANITYDIYYSFLIRKNEDDWKYVLSHEKIMDYSKRTIHIVDDTEHTQSSTNADEFQRQAFNNSLVL